MTLNRRQVVLGTAATAGVYLGSGSVGAAAPERIMRTIAQTGEQLPSVGMGSWLTFDVGRNKPLRAQRVKVLRAFFDNGGGLIDSSPMYGTSEETIGYCLKQIKPDVPYFSASKVWTLSKWLGVRQMQTSLKLWGVKSFDLMQIHNMVDWETHLATLKDWKAEGRIRYIGVTTSHGRRHDVLEDLMKSQPLDFVQFTYNILNRQAEQRLLPLARDRGQAVIINRPFERGGLFRHVRGKPLPDWAAEIDCTSWAQVFLKFILAEPAVTCVIPATTRVSHMHQNMSASLGRLPDLAMKRRMQEYVEAL